MEKEVMSAGLEPAFEVHPLAITVLRERGFDTEGMTTKTIDTLVNEPFDFVVTVCDHAKEHCPIFPNANNMIHWSIDDPAEFKGDYYQLLERFRETRKEVENRIKDEILSN